MAEQEENAPIRRRLPRRERERLIIDEAVRFFAEVGFEGQTRALAQRLGVTQPLLYRYFPDKEALIERVYEEVFEGGWHVEWEKDLADRSRPLEERLGALYAAYTQANFSYERVRLFMYVGLKDHAIGNRYLAFLREHLFVPLAREIRFAAGLDPDAPVSDDEIEMVAGLHGAVGYVGLRRWVYQTDVPLDTDAAIAILIRAFVDGAPAACRKAGER
jgi:Transcriptional regulator